MGLVSQHLLKHSAAFVTDSRCTLKKSQVADRSKGIRGPARQLHERVREIMITLRGKNGETTGDRTRLSSTARSERTNCSPDRRPVLSLMLRQSRPSNRTDGRWGIDRDVAR